MNKKLDLKATVFWIYLKITLSKFLKTKIFKKDVTLDPTIKYINCKRHTDSLDYKLI
jgi:hypothetical protein